ncbi:MAG: hypothetical protein WBB28_24945 [Crinalium sp.]
MALPNAFSPVEHLQDVIRLTMNRAVKLEFSEFGDNWEPDIKGTSYVDADGNPDTVRFNRAHLRIACMHTEQDSLVLTLVRLFLFFFVLRAGKDLEQAIYGIPVTDFQSQFKFNPQIQLHFQESDASAITNNRKPTRAQITIRFRDTSISKAEVKALALKIKTIFATPRLVYKKGRKRFSYIDTFKGYNIKVFGDAVADVKDLVEKILQVQGDTPDWENLNTSTSEKNFSTPKYETFAGRNIKLPIQRPLGDVKFAYATFQKYGMNQDIVLVDCVSRFRDALERV